MASKLHGSFLSRNLQEGHQSWPPRDVDHHWGSHCCHHSNAQNLETPRNLSKWDSQWVLHQGWNLWQDTQGIQFPHITNQIISNCQGPSGFWPAFIILSLQFVPFTSLGIFLVVQQTSLVELSLFPCCTLQHIGYYTLLSQNLFLLSFVLHCNPMFLRQQHECHCFSSYFHLLLKVCYHNLIFTPQYLEMLYDMWNGNLVRVEEAGGGVQRAA